ncbi:MAG: multiheme c-type cytochrome [Verrucomicrobiales bacterium]
MISRFATSVFSILFLAIGLTGCGKEKTGASVPFDLYFTCDTSGRIEPCGCFTGQYGGLTRVSTVLKGAAPGALKVEVGNAMAGLEDYHRIEFRHLLNALGDMGYAAVNLGEREARLPADTLRDLAAKSPVPLVSANLLDASTGESILPASVTVKTADGLSVAFLGVVDRKSITGSLDPSVRLAGMEESLRKVLSGLQESGVDVFVCLAFTDENGLEKLAREFYEFDFILGGDVRQPSPALAQVNQSWILATTNEARALGEIHAVFLPGAGAWEKPTTGDISLMIDTIPEDPSIRRHVAAYREEIRHAELAIDRPAELAADRVPGVEPAATYVGSATCAACHPKAHGSWAESGHAHAWDSLVARDSHADPSCIKCHSVGFGEPGGYLRSMNGEHLTGVGCESCHGPGSEHVASRSTASPGQEVLLRMRPVGRGQCTQCHYGEFSRPFDWDQFWPLVKHGREGSIPVE